MVLIEKRKLDDNMVLGESNLVKQLYVGILASCGGAGGGSSLDVHEVRGCYLALISSSGDFPSGGFLVQLLFRFSLLHRS